MANIQYIKDLDNNIIYPITHEASVRDSEGNRLSNKISSIMSLQDNMANNLEFLAAAVAVLDGRVMAVSWDGESQPSVSYIPEGVTVEYNGTSYTGTLAASAEQISREYLVFDGTENYDRYIVVQSGSSYTWIKYGTTGINLEDYKRKDEEVWLTEEAFNALPVKDITKTYNVYEEVSQL